MAKHQRSQTKAVWQQPETGAPVSPETPVAEKIPSHQWRREKTAKEGQYGKDDVNNKRQPRQSPTYF